MKRVSKQRLWQLRKRAAGKCISCGRDSAGRQKCVDCYGQEYVRPLKNERKTATEPAR